MITYDWNCKSVDAYPQDGTYTDVVYNVYWIATGTSDELNVQGLPYAFQDMGTQVFDVSNITTFIPFKDLTNEIVVEWTKGAMGAEKVAGIEANIQSQINALITPTSVALLIGGEMPGE